LYYPTRPKPVSGKAKHYWISRPISLQAEGLARFAGLNTPLIQWIFGFGLWAVAGRHRIPANVDVPLYVPAAEGFQLLDQEEPKHIGFERRENDVQKFPVYVFSHGAITSRTSYTQYCGELASRGVIVAAIDHRDGSGPGSVVITKDGKERTVFHVSAQDLQFDVLENSSMKGKDTSLDTAALKSEQLAFRQAEVEETINILNAINNGIGHQVYQSNTRFEGHDLRNWKDRLDVDKLILGGHSYGATLALRALKGAPSEKIPAKCGIILDPGKRSGPLNNDISVPILMIHSNSWSRKHSILLGRPHFDVVKKLTDDVMRRVGFSWFMTLLGTTHLSTSDGPLIAPQLPRWKTGSTINASERLKHYVRVSMEFIDFVRTGVREGILAFGPTHSHYGENIANIDQRTIPDEVLKYWQIHVAPPGA
jgi:platelet-activating factor acetylhydrolase